jgi:hypothetical protein
MSTTEQVTLSQEQLNVLTDSQKAEVARMEAFFASDGWQFLQNWIRQNIDLTTQRCLNAANWDTYLAARVQRAEFERWLNLEASFMAEYVAVADQALDSMNLEDEDQHE